MYVDRCTAKGANGKTYTRSSLCGVRVRMKGEREIYIIPRPRRDLERLFASLDILPPEILPTGQTNADTERKLTSRRK